MSGHIEVGQRAPDFVLPDAGGDQVRFYGSVGGVPTVVVLAAGAAPDDLADRVSALRSALAATGDLHVIGDAAQVGAAGGFVDAAGRVHAGFRVAPDGAPTAVVLAPDVRVAAVHPLEDTDAVVDAASRTRHHADDRVVTGQAPVLFVPRALSPAWCERLIDLWHEVEPVETGVEVSADGQRGEQADTLHKRRRDHVVADRQLLQQLTAHVGSRVLPEVQKAFAHEARGFEGFKIGCYDQDTQGFFAAHRDNLSPATAHRRFALTLNLDDDYAGGELVFPEYGRQRYRPAAGEALVFSGAHLHEVLPVTRGRRFVLLSFLFTDGRSGGAS